MRINLYTEEYNMKLIGNLKKQVEKVNSRDEAKDLIKNAGMMLTDDELEMVAGGIGDNNIIGDQEAVFNLWSNTFGPH